MVEPTEDTNAADRIEDAEHRLAAIAELASGPLPQRMEDAKRRLTAIAGLASGPVTPAGTPESNPMDAEARLIQINDIRQANRTR